MFTKKSINFITNTRTIQLFYVCIKAIRGSERVRMTRESIIVLTLLSGCTQHVVV